MMTTYPTVFTSTWLIYWYSCFRNIWVSKQWQGNGDASFGGASTYFCTHL